MKTNKLYCSTADVYRYSGINSTIVSTTNVIEFIKEAEEDVDSITQTTYWQLAHSSTAVTGSTNTLTTTGLESDEHIGNVIKVITGDRKSTRLNSSHIPLSRMPSSA